MKTSKGESTRGQPKAKLKDEKKNSENMAVTLTDEIFPPFVCNACFHSVSLQKYRCSKIKDTEMLITTGSEYTGHFSSHSNETAVCHQTF